jgi:hypothetical protein
MKARYTISVLLAVAGLMLVTYAQTRYLTTQRLAANAQSKMIKIIEEDGLYASKYPDGLPIHVVFAMNSIGGRYNWHNEGNANTVFGLMIMLLAYVVARTGRKNNRGNNHTITLAFEDGGSASVILEHSCCTGAGFDAVAIRTSDGQEYVADKNYCGIEGFRSELNTDSIKSLSMFSKYLEESGYRKR